MVIVLTFSFYGPTFIAAVNISFWEIANKSVNLQIHRQKSGMTISFHMIWMTEVRSEAPISISERSFYPFIISAVTIKYSGLLAIKIYYSTIIWNCFMDFSLFHGLEECPIAFHHKADLSSITHWRPNFSLFISYFPWLNNR